MQKNRNYKIPQEDVERASNINLVGYLQGVGVPMRRKGREYYLKEHGSLAINPHTNNWYWHSREVGGNGAISYLMKVENKSFPDAVDELLNGVYSGKVMEYEYAPEPPKEFVPPTKADTAKQLFGYLCNGRGIDYDVVKYFMRTGNLFQDKKRNVVFAGRDERGRIVNYHLKGTNQKRPFAMDGTGSNKKYGFSHVGKSERIFVFEAAIDMLSFISLYKMNGGENWQQDSYLALGGVSDKALLKHLELYTPIRKVSLALDNDDTGLNAMQRITDTLSPRYNVSTILPSIGKDWNDELKAISSSLTQGKSRSR